MRTENYFDLMRIAMGLTHLLSKHSEGIRMLKFFNEDYYADWSMVSVPGLSFSILMVL